MTIKMISNQQPHIVEINVWDVEKRYRPSKHYVYCIWVFWSDERKQLIFRRYSQFFELQCKLLDRFKTEAGVYDPAQRVLPFLPGKIIFGRSHIKSVALDRLHPINLYCKKLITLKKEISASDLVLKFFELNNEDISQSSPHRLNIKQDNVAKTSPATISKPFKPDEYVCVHNYKALSKTEISLKKGTKVLVIEKNLNGWWFVDLPSEGQGYVPKCVLKPVKELSSDDDAPIPTDKNERYIATRDYKPRKLDELEIQKGDYMDVVEKNLNGWWRVKIDSRVGKVPAVYLKKFNGSDPVKSAINAWDLFGSSDNYAPPRADFIDSKSTFDMSLSKADSQSNLSIISASNITQEDVYYVVQDYEDTVGDGISRLVQGQRVVVLDKENSSGWWFIRLDESVEGWAPSAYLSKHKPGKPPRPPKPRLSSVSTPDLLDVGRSFSFKPTDDSNNHMTSNTSNDNSEIEYKPVKVSEMRKKFENLKT